MSSILGILTTVIHWIIWFFTSLFNGDLFTLLGSMLRNLAVQALANVFNLLPSPDTSVFDPYCGSVNWLIPIDFSIGCLSIIVAALAIKMASGWILRWLW